MNRKHFLKILIIVAAVVAGFLFGLVYMVKKDSSNKDMGSQNIQAGYSELRKNIDGNKFINPLLECNAIENVSSKKINDMKFQVNDFINKKVSGGAVNFVSVYFRDLNNGPWFGINEKEKFIPGSLLKVPLAISIFKIAESDPGILQQEIFYEKKSSSLIFQYFKPEKEIEEGKVYTVVELIEAMIKYSDNNAALILYQFIAPEKIKQGYTDLGLEVPSNFHASMLVRDYAAFFRILFNATFLSKDFSEKSLDLLSQTTIKQGLRAGVPPNIAISHKFGERELIVGGEQQLHDCGIIYYPDKPYVLCIMSRGNDIDKLADVIKNISVIVYQEMDKP